MTFGIIGSSDWGLSSQQAYDKRKSHPVVVAVLNRFSEIEPGFEHMAERVLVACSMSFNNYSEEEGCNPSPATLLYDLEGGSWLPRLLTAIETAPLPDETERRIMIGAYMIAESLVFHETVRSEMSGCP